MKDRSNSEPAARDTRLELAKPKDLELVLLRQAKGMAASSSPEAVSTLVYLMRNSKMDKIRLEAAKAILERGVGRTREEAMLPPSDQSDYTIEEIERELSDASADAGE